MTTTTGQRYDKVAMTLHWIIGGLMIFMIFFGESLMEAAREGATPDRALFLASLHGSLGITILVLSVARLVWRLRNPPPALPAQTASWERTLGKATHLLFYVLMIGLPLTGLLSFGADVARNAVHGGASFFGLVAIPQINTSLPFGLAHVLGSKLGMGLVVIHVLAALKHQFINRDGLIRRMLPI